ncbi:hypothetical protein FJM65_13775 [Pontibacter mangrovi]|uniref:Thioredoxin domain-containing protein n=2 Tax=Pontibacter mangrovi TaxID=2589816 RepID=A0A501VZM8_9BACT|nr:hypothetical protein FJM65_13775 [Pontibacter mangrovi]
MKTYLLLFLFLMALAPGFAQKAGVSRSLTLGPKSIIYDEATGKQIRYEEFLERTKNKPHTSLTENIDKYGEASSYVLGSDTGGEFMGIDVAKRAKKGEAFPPFVMKGMNGEMLESEKMAGKLIVLNFQLYMREPFFNAATLQLLAQFESLISQLGDREEVVPIIVTHSSAEETAEALATLAVKSFIAPNSGSFQRRYYIVKVPSYIVVNRQGRLVGYADDLDELKKLLKEARS